MNPFDREIWARTVWAEARGEGPEGMKAVAHAILNRHDAQKWFSGKTMAATCLKAMQFSCWNANDPNREKCAALDFTDPTLEECRKVCDRALSDHRDPTDGSTHYYASTMVQAPTWAEPDKFVKQIGRHRFYRDVR